MPPDDPPMFSARPASSLSRARGCAREREGRAACGIKDHFLALCCYHPVVITRFTSFIWFTRLTSHCDIAHYYHYHYNLLSLNLLVSSVSLVSLG